MAKIVGQNIFGWDPNKADAGSDNFDKSIDLKDFSDVTFVPKSQGSMKTPEGMEVPYMDTYRNIANKYGVPLSTVLAVSHAETGGTFNPKATSPTGVVGLMQTTKGTTSDMGFDPSQRHVPEVSIEAGVKYIKKLMDERKIDPNDAVGLMLAYTTPAGGYTEAYGKKVQGLIEHYGGTSTEPSNVNLSDSGIQTLDEFLGKGKHGKPSISSRTGEDYNLIESGIKAVTDFLGLPSILAKDTGLSEAAKAQALIEFNAKEAGIPIGEYREGSEFIRQFAENFGNMASFTILNPVKEAITGEIEFTPDTFAGYAGKGLGSLAGFLVGPAKFGKLVTSPITSKIVVTKELPLALRTLRQGLKESLILSPAVGASLFGESLKEKSFKDAAGTILGGLKSGAITGAIFGTTRGMFPEDVSHRAARIITGLVGLNAQRALEHPGMNLWDRPAHEVIFDTAMDVFFMWRGLPGRFNEFEELTKKMLKGKDLTDSELDSIIAESSRLVREASRENNKEAENIIKIEQTNPPKPKVRSSVKKPGEVRPADVDPDYTYTSKKGNYYERIGDTWFDSKGREVINKAKARTLERNKVKFGVSEDEASDALVAEIEAKFGKPFEEISDKEIEDYIIDKESGKPVVDAAENGAKIVEKPVETAKVIGEEIKTTEPIELYHQSPDEFLSGRPEFDAYFGTKEFNESFNEEFGQNLIKLTLPKGKKIVNLDSESLTGRQFMAEVVRSIWGDKEQAYIDKLLSGDRDAIKEFYDIWTDKSKIIPIIKKFKYDGAKFGDEYILTKETIKSMPNQVINLDLQTGTTESTSQFRQEDKEFTKQQLSLLPSYKEIIEKKENPDVLMHKMETEVNAWLDGESIDIDFTKNLSSMLADNLKKWADGSERPAKMFDSMTRLELKNFAERMRKFDEWISGLKESSGTDLYMGIPIDKIYGKARDVFDRLTGRDRVKVDDEIPTPFTGVKKEAREYLFGRIRELATKTYETSLFVNSIEQRTTKEQREVMPFVIEKTNIPDKLGRPDLQKIIEQDRKMLEPIAEEIKQHFDKGFKYVKENLKDMTVKQVEDYVTHLWDIPRHKKAEAINWFQTQDRFMERRFIPTYEEGIKRGYIPKVLDISEIIKIHDNMGNRAVANTKYINALLAMERDGIKLIDRSGDAPLDWIEIDYPALTRRIPLPKNQVRRKGEFVKETKIRVHPDLVRPLKAIFESRFDHSAISAYEALNGIMKKTKLSLSLFHHLALTESAVAFIGLKKTVEVLNPVKLYKAIANGDYAAYTKEPIARDAAGHLLQFGPTADIPVARIQGYLNELARVAKDIPLADRLTKFMSKGNELWDKMLWSYLHDTFKLYAYETQVGKLDPKMGADETRRSKIEIAQIINDTFGGQNWESLNMTPKEVQMLTWSLLSADWTFSTTRQALAPTGVGKIYGETAWLRRRIGAAFWGRAGLYFGLGVNLLNAYFRDRDIKENPQYYKDKEFSFLDKTMFGNTIGKKTNLFVGRYGDGSERYVRWGKQFRDFFELLINPLEKLGGKAAPIPQLLSEIFTGSTLSGFKNDDINKSEGLKKALEIGKTVGKSFLPISVRRFMQENIEVHPLDIAMQSSKGLSRYHATEYFKKAIVNGDEDLIKDVYTSALRNNLPAYTIFTNALSWAEGELMSGVSKDVKDLNDAKMKLSNATSSYDKMRYGKIVARLSREKADKESGLSRLKVALERARIYKDIGVDKSELHREYR